MLLETLARALLALALLYLLFRAVRALRRAAWRDRPARLRLPRPSDDALILAVVYGAIFLAAIGMIFLFVRAA